MKNVPRIALTMGDPAGVGPELALRTALRPEVHTICRPLIVGNRALLARVAEKLALLPAERLRAIEKVNDLPGDYESNTVFVCETGTLDAAQVVPGRIDATTGRCSYDCVETAISLAQRGDVAGIVTGPIHKTAWRSAGVPFIGHTELLAARTNSPRVRMMLASEKIACALVTVHIGLADVPQQLSVEGVAETIRLTHQVFQKRYVQPRIAVCGLNPHAGEEGLIGHGEEEKYIVPAIEQTREEGIEVRGPIPPDTAFIPQQRVETDAYVCMYHDQGLIPLKALSFDDAVNVTLGLPIVRTSVDHGTALDLAWQGIAKESSFLAAIEMAVRFAGGRG